MRRSPVHACWFSRIEGAELAGATPEIAAITAVRGFTVATRKTAAFEEADAPVVNLSEPGDTK